MLPSATPRKIAADARVFLVAPPTLPEMRERARTKTALEDPVRSGSKRKFSPVFWVAVNVWTLLYRGLEQGQSSKVV